MEKQIYHYYEKVLRQESIVTPHTEELLKQLVCLGFVLQEKENDYMSVCKYPKGWSTKPRWDPKSNGQKVVSVHDNHKRERVVVSFTEWRSDMAILPEILIVPRFEIRGPVGQINTKTTRVFINDHGYPFRDNRNMYKDEVERLQSGEEFNGPTSLILRNNMENLLKKEFPEHTNPLAYWDLVNDL